MKYIAHLLLLLLLFLQQTHAQTITFLPNQSQLPVGNVHCIMQDSEGYMWYATIGGGLCRDNGFQIDVFRGNEEGSDAFTNLDVEDICEDRNRHIWIATDGGLFMLDKRDYSIHRMFATQIQEQTVNDVILRSDGKIWVCFANHYARINDQLQMEKLFTASNPGDGNKRVNCFFEDSHHNFFLLECRGDILVWNQPSGRFVSTGWTGPEPSVIAEDTRRGGYWIGTWGEGIFSFSMKLKNGHLCVDDLTHQAVTQGKQVISLLFDDATDILYQVDMRGIDCYRPASDGHLVLQSLGAALPTGYNILDKIYRDHNGNVWVAGFSPHTFIIANPNTSVRRNIIPQIIGQTGYRTFPSTIIPEGKALWLWLRRVGLTYYDQAKGICLMSRHDYGRGTLEGQQVMSRCAGGQKGLWLADGTRIMHVWYDGALLQWQEVCDLGTEALSLCDPGKGTLFIGTKNQILSLDYQPLAEGRTAKTKVVASDATWVSELAIDCHGNPVFIGRDRHLTTYDVRTRRCHASDSISNAFYLRPQSDGVILALSQNGTVWEYDSRRGTERLLARASDGNVLLQNAALDGHGNLWEVQDQKVYRINLTTSTARSFHCSDANLNVDYLAGLAVAGDSVYVGGCGALLCFDASAQLYEKEEGLKPVVACVVIDGRRHFVSPDERELDISSSTKVCEIQITSFNYLDTKTQQFLYRIPELGGGWKYLPQGQNTIQLIGLPKGTYTVQTRLLGGAQDDASLVSTIIIHRLPAWWETWWAYLIYIILFVALILTVEHYVRRYRVNKRNLAELQQRLDALIKDEETKVEDIPQEVATNELDQQFLQKTIECIHRNMDNTDYSIEALASDMCMSRMNLYRKLTSLTGQKPAEFMRSLRLKRAAEILRSHEKSTIAEVADMVGFSTPGYFSKCFKEMFGCLPTQFA